MADDTLIQLAVFGNPIAHSCSPQIHQAFAKEHNLQIDFQKILVEPRGFASALDLFQEEGGHGCSVTLPLKEEAFEIVDECSERAKRAGAVNTILFKEDGSRFGDNTDGIGLVRDMKNNHNVEMKNKSILLLGAGGAARGVLGALLDESPEKVTVVNRTKNKAEQLASTFNVQGCGYADLGKATFDIIINATSASLSGEIPPLSPSVLNDGTFCYDLAYSQELTPFFTSSNFVTV